MSKKSFGLYSESLDVSKSCATCKFGKQLTAVEDIICEKYGLVSSDSLCKHYFYNRLIKHPPKKHSIKKSDFEKNDFLIE